MLEGRTRLTILAVLTAAVAACTKDPPAEGPAAASTAAASGMGSTAVPGSGGGTGAAGAAMSGAGMSGVGGGGSSSGGAGPAAAGANGATTAGANAAGAAAGAAGDETSGQAGAAGSGAGMGGQSTSGGGGAEGTPEGGAGNGGAGGSMEGGVAGNGGAGDTGAGGASAGAGGSSASPFPPDVTSPRIMIVGDSISAGPGCYKQYLLQDLMDNGYSSFEFVGEYTDDCGSSVRHSAVSCSTAEQYTMSSFMMPNCFEDMTFPGMSTLVTNHMPDLIMLQLGVNDVWNGRATDAILQSYTTLVEQARAQNPNIVLVVAQINKIRPDCTNEAVTTAAEALVNAVPAWAASQNTAQSPVFVADLWTNSDYSMAETTDCVHPNDVGAQKMGLNWYNALKDILPK